MSQSAAPIFDVTLSQLSPDGKKAGIDYTTTERLGLSSKELRGLLNAAAAVAPEVVYPLTPEVRITAPSGKFVVQLREGRLNFISWASTKSRGGNPTVDQIVAIVGGEVAEADLRIEETPVAATPEASTGRRKILLGVMLGLVVVGLNVFTFTSARRPPGNFLPPLKVMDSGPAERLLASLAGNYETGTSIGDRRLQISKNGTVIWIKFGANRTTAEEKTFTTQAVDASGTNGLLTNRKGLIKVKDPTTVTLFGDVYTRVK